LDCFVVPEFDHCHVFLARHRQYLAQMRLAPLLNGGPSALGLHHVVVTTIMAYSSSEDANVTPSSQPSSHTFDHGHDWFANVRVADPTIVSSQCSIQVHPDPAHIVGRRLL
jgi:hypothetical protein